MTADGVSIFQYENILGGFTIYLDRKLAKYNRSIYSSLEFLGDVGGLLDMLNLIA